MSRQLNKNELLHRAQIITTFTESFTKIAVTLIRYGGVVAIVFFIYKCVDCLAGKETVANFAMDMIGSIKVNQWVAYSLAALTSGWAVGERTLRRRRTANLSKRITELEKLIDPRRSSSMLPPSGTTRSGDL